MSWIILLVAMVQKKTYVNMCKNETFPSIVQKEKKTKLPESV